MLNVKSKTDKRYDGELFAVDPVTHSLAIKSEDGSYSIINLNHIQELTDLQSLKPTDITKLGLSITECDQEEAAALKIAEANLEFTNFSVGHDVQALFDRFNKFYKCKWQDKSILILDEYIIQPPYETVQLLPGKDGASLERISKMLETERKKLNL